ncbi:hypothetical protein [Christiangramia sp. SM2212]|uniref:Adhesin domain-containing protein n=1 Tax=Christiangramia sediminicola TaxID=3073267 RepID=A0ABU1ESW3_9FLAO|nr:hypothetical protein [Christiangramia sp. SM2212]MDR5591481.1 hypothetical protein [Christiangramia sp. SM2212]
MKKDIIFVFLVLLNSLLVFSQKDTRESIDAHQIESIRIDTDEVYLINLKATETSQIKISTHSEGEYFNYIILESEIRGSELIIRTKYPQRLTGGFDKLSAHKVFSLEIQMEIPEDLEIIINSNIASLQGKGRFKSVYADLKQGYCKLTDYSGTAVINTYSGNILVETNSGLIEAESRNGKVKIPEFLPGRNPLRLTSIDGDIMVRKN